MRIQNLCICMILMCSYVVTSLEHEKSFLLQDGASNVLSIGLYKDSLLVTSSNDVIQKDTETGIVQRTFRAHDKKVYYFAVTDDERMLTSGYDNMIVVWDLVTGSILKRIRLRTSDSRIESLVVRNNLVIVGGLDNKVRQVDLVSGRVIKTIDVDGNVYSIAVGDEHFYVGKQNAPYIMRFLIQGATENLRFDGHSKTVFTIYWSNNILVSGGADTDVICWNATNANIIRILNGHTYEVYAVGLFEGFVYSGGENRVVFKWNIDNGDILERFPLIHDTAIKSFANRPSELFTGSIDATVIRWDTISGNMLIQYRGRNKKLRAVATWKTFVMSAGEDIEINIWDASVNSAEPLLNLLDHTQPINTLTIYEDILYSGSSDATVLQWDLTNFSLSKMFEGYRDTIISITADQYFVYAAGFARAIYQWNVSSGSVSGSFEGHTNDVNCLKLNNNFILSGSTDRTVRVWDLQLKEAIRVFNAVYPIIYLLNDGNVVITATDIGMQSFSFDSGDTLIYLEELALCWCIISMQNRVITSHSDGVIRVRDWNTLAVLELYQGHSDVVSALCLDTAFSLYSTGFDGTIKKWNMATRKVAFSYENRGNSVNALAASEEILLVGLRGGGIISYNIHDASALDTISFNTKPVSSLLSLNGSFYGAGLDGLLVKFREFSQTNTYIVYNSETEPLRSLEFDGRNLIVLLGESKAVFFSNDQIVKTAELQTSLVCIAATNDFLLGGSRSGAVFSWNIETFELEFELKGHVAQVNFILVVGQRLFSASDDKTIIEWSLDDRVTVNTYQRLSANALGHLGPINSLSYSYETLFSAGADLSVRRWNIQTGRHEDVYFGFSKAVTTVLFHNGSVFAGSEDFAVLMFRPSFNDLSQASTSSRTITSKSEIRRRRIVQRSQSIGSSNSSLLSIIIGLVVSIIFAASFIFLFVYWKSGTRKQVPDISTSLGFDSNTTVTDLRTIVNSVMGISKHAAFLVENSAFAKVKKIATGGGGELFLAKVMDPGLRKKLPENVIQKVLFGINNKISEEAFYQEVGIMILLSSFPNFCQIVGYTENPLSMILKHYPHGSLDDWLGKNNYGTKIILKILKETALALSIMHSHYLAHCDLKPQNILVEVDNGLPSCYLTDFGITQILSEKIIATKAFHVINLRGLSTHYAAPEALRNFRTKNYILVDFKAYDIYSFGCIAYEVLTKNMPWA